MKILLKEIMTEKGLSIRQVEFLTGVPRTTIHRMLKGQIPRADILEELAIGLKVKITELIETDAEI